MAEIITVKMRDYSDVSKFIATLMKAHEATKKSKLRFKGGER